MPRRRPSHLSLAGTDVISPQDVPQSAVSTGILAYEYFPCRLGSPEPTPPRSLSAGSVHADLWSDDETESLAFHSRRERLHIQLASRPTPRKLRARHILLAGAGEVEHGFERRSVRFTLDHQLSDRMSEAALVQRNILPARVSGVTSAFLPLQHTVKRRLTSRSLQSKLVHRPSRDMLIRSNILRSGSAAARGDRCQDSLVDSGDDEGADDDANADADRRDSLEAREDGRETLGVLDHLSPRVAEKLRSPPNGLSVHSSPQPVMLQPSQSVDPAAVAAWTTSLKSNGSLSLPVARLVLQRMLDNRPAPATLVSRNILHSLPSVAPCLHCTAVVLDRRRVSSLLEAKLRARPPRSDRTVHRVLSGAATDAAERSRVVLRLEQRLTNAFAKVKETSVSSTPSAGS